jgi:hypothetical protein
LKAALLLFQSLDLPLYFGGKISDVLGGHPVPELTRQPATLFEPVFQFLFFALLLIHGRAPLRRNGGGRKSSIWFAWVNPGRA